MKIELRNIQIVERMSEETTCFAATVYIDGAKAFSASNEGHGGPTRFDPIKGADYSAIKAAEAWAKTQPGVVAFGTTLEMDLELYVGNLLEDYRKEREVKRALAKRVVFRIGAKLMQINTSDVKLARASIERKHKDFIILNELPLAEAVKAYFGNDEEEAAAA